MNKNKSRKKMKSRKENTPKLPLILGIGAALLLFGSIFLLQNVNSKEPFIPEVRGAPSLKFDKDKIDVGDIQLGKTVRTAFEYTNVGDETLYLYQDSTYVEVVEGC